MTQSWDSRPLKAHLLEPPFTRIKEGAYSALVSIGRASNIFQYHLEEALERIGDVRVQKERQVGMLDVLRSLGAAEDQGVANLKALAAEAHTLGCIRTVRAMYDYLAQLVNLTLLPKAIDKPKMYAEDVWRKVPEGRFKVALETVIASDQHLYISRYDNLSKHRTNISFGFSVSFVEDRAGLSALGFSQNDKAPDRYANRFATEVLGDAVYLRDQLALSLGPALNAELGL